MTSAPDKSFILPKGDRPIALKRVRIAMEALDKRKAWRVRFEVVKSERSEAQNAYLWGVVNKMISERTGYEPEEVHEYLCGRMWGWKEKKVPKTPSNPKGIEDVPIRTTTKNERGQRSVLSPQEFSDYVAFCQRFAAATMGLVIPDPDPNYALHRERAQQVEARAS